MGKLTVKTPPPPQNSFGLIASEKGFNIFVAGNGGAKPKHSELLAKDVAPTEVIPILDRYLMFYIRTADKLQRTARWIESLPGGIAYLREVILDDKLGICASLESQMQELVDSYFDEWAEAINTPAIASKFRQFANTPETVENMELEVDRGQTRPVMWPKDNNNNNPTTKTSQEEEKNKNTDFKSLSRKWSSTTWQPVLPASYFTDQLSLATDQTIKDKDGDGDDGTSPNGISATIKRGDTQLAVWRLQGGRYFASQQMCPHKRAFILSDGLIGQDISNTNTTANYYISCPNHKRNFSLSSGSCLNDNDYSIATFEAEERPDGLVYLKLPPVEELDAALGTKKWIVKKGEAGPGAFDELDKKISFRGVARSKRPGVRPHAELPMRRPVELMVGGGGGCGSVPDW